jgi:hypothetical protein
MARGEHRTLAALAGRVEALDAEHAAERDSSRDVRGGDERGALLLARFVAVMSRWTDARVEMEAGAGAAIEPSAADELTRGSRLLADIRRHHPTLTTGPMDSNMQQWTPIGRPAYTGEPPGETSFVAPQANQRAAVKPTGVGLYTSTACSGGVSMWRALLGPGGSAARPLPRYTWHLTLAEPLAVAEIASATQWAEFVSAHARHVGGAIYPDWVAISRSFDAVHITLPAIAAAQGFALTTADGTIAPAFWDVETTFWVTWRVSSAEMVEGQYQ